MKGTQKRWSVVLRIVRVASELSQDQLAEGFHRDQAFVSRVEANKTVITPEIIAQWIGLCGGQKLIDHVIRQLQLLRKFLDMLDFPQLQQA